ncbi:hypothetical protein N8878_06800 [Psychromonas sp.]|nr:hypothetical protein [Psychromonas sp.]
MNFKKTKIAAAVLSATLLFGCGSGSDSVKSVVDYLDSTEVTALLSAEQIAELEAAGLTAADLTTIVAGVTDAELQAAIDAAIANVGANKYVVLTDDSTSANAQLLYTLPAAQTAGKLTAKIKVDSSDEKLSYITLFDASGSVKTSPLDLKIGGSDIAAFGTEAPADTSIIKSRGTTNGDVLTDLTLDTLTWVNISLEWNGSTVDVVISDLDGNELSSDTLDYQDGDTDAVTKVGFQVGDSSNVTTTSEPIAIDNFMVYGADLTTVLFSDEDFADLTLYNSSRGAEVLTEGVEYITELTAAQVTALSDAGVVDTSGIINGNMTQDEVDAAVAALIAAAEAVGGYVAELTDAQTTALTDAGVSQDDIDGIIVGNMSQAEVDAAVEALIEAANTPVGEVGNLVAQLLDTNANGSADGELRIKFADSAGVDSLEAGQISATIMMQADADSTADTVTYSTTNTGYVSLYGSGTSSTNLHGDIIFSGGEVKYRDDLGSQSTIDGLTWTDGEAIEFVVTWAADDTWSFSIDGGTTFNGPYVSREKIATSPITLVAFKIGTSSDVATYEMNVDNIEILDGDSASLYSEDFENGYSVDDDLDGTGVFDSNSNEVTVQEVEL